VTFVVGKVALEQVLTHYHSTDAQCIVMLCLLEGQSGKGSRMSLMMVSVPPSNEVSPTSLLFYPFV